MDPSQFPRSLMAACERIVLQNMFSPSKPKDILCKGYEETLQNKEELLG